MPTTSVHNGRKDCNSELERGFLDPKLIAKVHHSVGLREQLKHSFLHFKFCGMCLNLCTFQNNVDLHSWDLRTSRDMRIGQCPVQAI